MFQQKRSPYIERTGRSEHGGTKTARYVSPNTDLCTAITEWKRVPKGNTSNNNINHTEYIKTEESENDFSKNRKAEAEEAPARNSDAKLSAYQEHQYHLEKTYAQKGAEAAKQTARQDWWPENFQELSLNQRAELWRQQARKRQQRE